MTDKIIPNAFQTPNLHVDAAMELLSGDEYKILNFATRHILGWQDKLGTNCKAISLTMFEHGYDTEGGVHYGGTGLSCPTIIKLVGVLCAFGLLIKLDASSDGQEYGLGDSPDWQGLEQRQAQKQEQARQKMEKVRASRAGKSHLPLNGINHPDQLMALTDDGKSHLVNQNHLQSHKRSSQPIPDGTDDDDPDAPAVWGSTDGKHRRAKSAASKPKPPRPRNLLFDAVALHIFGISDPKAEGGRIAKISNWLDGKFDGKGFEKVGFISSPAMPEQVQAFARWCSEQQFTPPHDFVKFVENWRKWAQSSHSPGGDSQYRPAASSKPVNGSGVPLTPQERAAIVAEGRTKRAETLREIREQEPAHV